MSAVDPILAEFGYFDVATVNATDGKSASGHIPLRRDRGIVVTVAEKNPSAWLSAQVDFLRSYGCNLPIEVWAYEQEITAEIVQTIAKLSTRQAPVFYRVVQDYRHLYRIKEDHGYQIKLAAIANSAFREILYLDSDVIPFKNPELLFESPEFKRYGSIFWVDYWKMHPYNPAWRLFGLECVDEWEQESGMMVIDRKRAWFAIRLAGYFWRDLAATKWHQNFLLGDKDFFRLSWRATSTPAFFIPHWLTPAGLYLPLSNKFCGITMVQHDVEGGPLFAHINLLKRYILSKKYVPGNSILTHVKRYKLPPFRDYPFPAGPLPRTKLKWAHTRGFKASLPNIDEVQCVDIDDGERFGVSPVTEIVPLSNINPSFGKDLDRVLGGYIDAELKKSSYHPE
ncbi:mannosyltransferase putative-domain-containing protein [Cladochytrium replicatum]|nr:mannosyltransferase putative-domain-containing protein [Cladochytrium replicatum]